MRTLITTALLAAMAVPATASAQSRDELRRDRQDIREEQRDLNQARRWGDRDDVRDQRSDLREARQEYREDLRGRAGDRDWRDDRTRYADGRDGRRGDWGRDDRGRGEWNRDGRGGADWGRRDWGRGDWSSWRQQNRSLYARGDWRAPFGYQSFRPGARIGAGYYGQRYVINDPWRYHLPPARGYSRWVRHYNDVILVDQRRGVVVDVIRNFYW
jgi:Ni/Co efflux regulator RcnB